MIKLVKLNKEEIFERISKGIPFDKKLKLYSKIQLQLVLQYLEEKEEFEKCEIVKSFIEKRFDHKSNY